MAFSPFQQQCAAYHLIAPGSGDRAGARPLLPEGSRRVEARLDLGARRKHERFGVRRADPQQRPIAFPQIERRPDTASLPDRHSRVPTLDRHCVGAAGRHRDAAPPSGTGGTGAVIELRGELPAHRNRPGHPLERSHDLAHRLEVAVRNRQRVDHPHRAAIGGERRFQHVAVRKVPAGAVESQCRLQLERPAAAGIDNRCEHAWRIEIGKTQPVDRAIARHQRGRPAVANQRVVFDWGIAVEAHQFG